MPWNLCLEEVVGLEPATLIKKRQIILSQNSEEKQMCQNICFSSEFCEII